MPTCKLLNITNKLTLKYAVPSATPTRMLHACPGGCCKIKTMRDWDTPTATHGVPVVVVFWLAIQLYPSTFILGLHACL